MAPLKGNPHKESHLGLWPQLRMNSETRMSNIEQGIWNDEVKVVVLFPLAFDIRYSIFCGSLSSAPQHGKSSGLKR
jgi:hypothetical protein